MDVENAETKSVRLLTFGGEQKDFQVWWTWPTGGVSESLLRL